MFDYDHFRTDLAKKAREGRMAHAKAQTKRKMSGGSQHDILASIFEAIEELKAMVAAGGGSNAVTFTVTERDVGGRIKSFKVE